MDRRTVTRRLAAYLEYAGDTMPANTARALRSDIDIFCKWCEERNRVPVPADGATLVAFMQDMMQSKSRATVLRHVASIATLHRILGKANPAASDGVRHALKHLRKRIAVAGLSYTARGQAPVEGLNRALCRKLIEMSGTGLIDARNRALLAVAYDTLLRRSELTRLEPRDLVWRADGSGTVRLRASDGASPPETLFVASDTVGHMREWLERAGIGEERLFRSVRPNGRLGKSLHPGQIQRIYKAMARAAKLSPEVVARISGQSTRVGAVQDMLAAGIDRATIVQAGRRRNAAMVRRYVDGLDAADNTVVQAARPP